jgi:cytosine/uracil/thiamine/allantoin permease
MVYMLTFIVTNSFLKIIAVSQNIEATNQSLGDANDALGVLVFRKYFVCWMNWGAPELNISDFAIFETDTQISAPELCIPLKYYSV